MSDSLHPSLFTAPKKKPSVTACGPEKCQAGYNALQAASMSGQLESVQMLLEAMEFFGFRVDGNMPAQVPLKNL